MKTTCIINNFNYASYVIDAINTALKQSVSFDEIIVVDDSSVDNSVYLIKENFAKNPRVKLIRSQENLGQLNSLNQGYIHAKGDIIFFLDSDDLYKDKYLEEALKIYANDPACNFLFCETEKFTKTQEILTHPSLEPHQQLYNLGYSVASTFYASDTRVGISTSGISIKKEILDQFMPIPLTEDWKISADQCLNWGASLVGAKKYYLKSPLLVNYRIHGHNNWFNQSSLRNYENDYLKALRISRLLDFLISRMKHKEKLCQLVGSEFRTIPKPTFRQLRIYLNIVIARKELSFPEKIKTILVIIKHYFYGKKYV